MAKKLQGWEKGAGVYSRSYAKLSPDRLLSAHEPTAKAIRNFKALSGNAAGAAFTGKTWQSQWRDIDAKVTANSANASKNTGSSLPGGPGGFSGRVSKSKTPKHKQGSWKRV